MTLPTYAKFKRGHYYYQRRVPADVRNAAPFDTMPVLFEKRLNATDLNNVLRAIAEINEWFERCLSSVRKGEPLEESESAPPSIRPAKERRARKLDIAWARMHARAHYDHLVSSTRIRRREARHGDLSEARYDDWLANEVTDLNSKIDGLREGDHRLIRLVALRICASDGLISALPSRNPFKGRAKRHPIEDTSEFELLSDALIDAEIEAYQAIRRLLDIGLSDYSPTSETLTLAPKSLEDSEKYDLRRVAERLIEESPKTSSEWRSRLTRVVDVYEDFFGSADVRDLEPKHIRDLVAKLAQCPANKVQRFPGKTWREAVIENGVRKLPTLDPNSIRDAFVAPMKRILAYGESLGFYKGNPAGSIKVPHSKRGARGTHFETHELNKLFRQPIFTGCKSPKQPAKPGDLLLDNHWYWAPLIALFTGARTTEIAQLTLAETHLEGPCPYFTVQAGEGRRLKTAAARRAVPIHPKLIDLGFADYVRRLRKRAETRLFPDWIKPKGKDFGDAPSQKHFRRTLIPAVTIRVDPNPTFHSFRNTMKAAMFDSLIPAQHQNAILGHEQEGMTGTYLTSIKIETLYKSMARVRFEGLEIDHLVGSRSRLHVAASEAVIGAE